MRILSLLIVLLPSIATASTLEGVIQSVKNWNPMAVEFKEGKVLIVLNDYRLTSEIYKSILKNGICTAVWFKKPNALDGVEEITILNKHRGSGYIFEGGESKCKEMGKLSDDDVHVYLWNNTRLP